MCQGYYAHDQGYTPEWPGAESYKGRIVHPQTWPADLDLSGKRVLVIGSGATAATVVPAIAGQCAHVTLLQRSPTYFIPGRNANDLATQLRQLEIDETWIHEIVRRKVLFDQAAFTRRAREEPETVKAELLAGVSALLPEGYDVATHFTPRYRPWRQRIAFVPDGDLFQGIASGAASVVTGEIERFTSTGVQLKSGEELRADVIITATGFNLCADGGIALSVDGRSVRLSDTVTYRGMMFTGLPNYLWVFGYFRASWTLRVDILAKFVCRLLTHMDALGKKQVDVMLPPEDRDAPLGPWIDEEDFNPGYIQRGAHLLPKCGPKPDWRHTQDYWREKDEIPAIDLDGPEFVYS
jgi:cation diffusion facilitator CzcD-associated flavoprotein CzcO